MNPIEKRHRNAHPDDEMLFSGRNLEKVQTAVYELCWLFNRGYARHSAITLVGDHHQLTKRQRLAIGRAACSDADKQTRDQKLVALEAIKGRHILIDGFNLIITLEAAMAGAVLMRCHDGCIRDLASVHGTYRPVKETEAVITLIGETLAEFAPASVYWLFDKPISNSGRLALLVQYIAQAHDWNWHAELHDNPDRFIVDSGKIAITSDSAILDGAAYWINLSAFLIDRHFPDAWLLDFS